MKKLRKQKVCMFIVSNDWKCTPYIRWKYVVRMIVREFLCHLNVRLIIVKNCLRNDFRL